MRMWGRLRLLGLLLAVSVWACPAVAAGIEWKPLDSGITYAAVPLTLSGARLVTVHVVRVDPAQAEFFVGLVSLRDHGRLAARTWCDRYGLAVAINLGMYQADFVTHAGYLRHGDHLNSGGWVRSYQSVLALGPKDDKLPHAALLDLPGEKAQTNGYQTLVQNMRLIKGHGEAVWRNDADHDALAALGIDDNGRLVLIFIAETVPLAELTKRLTGAPFSLLRAQYLEGGREASLSVHGGGVDLDLAGQDALSRAAGVDNPSQSLLPNILGVVRHHYQPR